MADKMFSCWLTRNQVDFYTDFITRQPLVLSLLLKSLFYVLRAVFLRIERWWLRFYMSLCAQLKGAINASSTLATVSALYSPLSLFLPVFVFLPFVGTMRFLIRAFGANMP